MNFLDHKHKAINIKCAVLGSGSRGSVFAQNRDNIVELLLAFTTGKSPASSKYMGVLFERSAIRFHN